MNGQVLLFTRKAAAWRGAKVLEVGSMDVNGSPRGNFLGTEYIGIDIRPGNGVDLVMAAEELPEKFGPEHFDRVLMCETLEHCENWKDALRGAWRVLKVGGVMCITTPTIKKGRHNYPSDYWRWTLEEYRRIFAKQNIRRCEEVHARGIGAIVEKVSEELDTDFEPHRIT